MTTETADTLASALARAQAEISNPAPNDSNPHFNNKFTNLAGCIDAVKPSLTKYGIAVVQAPSWCDGTLTVRTVLMHGAESVECSMSCKAPGDPQKIGSALTYLRRYSLCAMVGISSDKDDDGNAGSENSRPFVDRRPPPSAPKPPVGTDWTLLAREESRRAGATPDTIDALCKALVAQPWSAVSRDAEGFVRALRGWAEVVEKRDSLPPGEGFVDLAEYILSGDAS